MVEDVAAVYPSPNLAEMNWRRRTFAQATGSWRTARSWRGFGAGESSAWVGRALAAGRPQRSVRSNLVKVWG